ncbi:inner membrane protein YpjD [Radiobacillus sp. PE A8.2]|uniref:cytochrome C assembly family protein n=1 Tax=Radiobacillus sp. PE A8.2 TaxID=3380349 RepID=UPI003890D929
MNWLHAIILIIYSASVVGYFIDFVQKNQKANKIAFWLLSVVWLAQTIFLLYQNFLSSASMVLNLYDGLYFYAWILVTLSLTINRLFNVDFFVFFTNLLGFFIMLLHFLTYIGDSFVMEQGTPLIGEILIIHIGLAILSYGFFSLSFILSLMYLLQYHLLKSKRGYPWLKRLGDLERLDRISFQTVTIGVPSLLLSIVLGVTWAYQSGTPFYWYDVKTIGSLLVLVVYIIYLFLRLMIGYQGRAISLYNTGAFLFLLVNFFLFSSLSTFHF